MTLFYQRPLKDFLFRRAGRLSQLIAGFPQAAEAFFKGQKTLALDWETIDAFFATERHVETQKRLAALSLRTLEEERKRKAIQSALEEMQAGYFLYRRRLSFEIADRLLEGYGEVPLEVDEKGKVEAVSLNVAELENRLQQGMLKIRGVSKRSQEGAIVFVADAKTPPQALFDRALLECDTRQGFVISSGQARAKDGEVLALLCIANQLTWRSDTSRYHNPWVLQKAIDALPASARLNPYTIYCGLQSDPEIQAYYVNGCLVWDRERLYDVYARLNGIALQHFSRQFQYPRLLKGEWILAKQKQEEGTAFDDVDAGGGRKEAEPFFTF